MFQVDNIYEYELIGIATGYEYEYTEENYRVCEDSISDLENSETLSIEYDDDGIPMGQTIPEIKEREKIIKEYLHKWGETNPERAVYNIKLEDKIHVRGISVIEAREHSSKSYKSTRAVLIFDEVLKNATPIKRVPIKPDDKNQKDFVNLIVMLYKHPDIGSIKLTLGVKKKNNMKIQYGLSALKPDQPIIDYSQFKKVKKKRNSHR